MSAAHGLVSLVFLAAVLRGECAGTIQGPKPPSFLDVITISKSEVKVNWGVPGTTPRMRTVYELRWTKDGTNSESVKRVFGVKGTTSVRGLHAFTVYRFRIRRGHSSNGTVTWGRFTRVTWAKTDEGTPTAPPANVTAYNTSSISIMVRWDQVPTEHRHGAMLGYKICYQRADKNDSLMFCIAVRNNALELGGLSHFKPYLVTVLAFTNEGEGPACKPLLVWTDEFVPVRSPKLLSIKSTATSVKLRWAPIAQQYVNGILRGYHITVSARSHRERNVLQVNASTIQVEVHGLSRNTTYGVQLRGLTRVRGVIRRGSSGPAHNFTTKFGCGAPKNVQASSSCSTCIEVQWDPVSPTDPTIPVEGYHVTYMANLETRQTKITGSQETSLKLDNLQTFTAYSLSVAAVTSEGLGEASQPITVVTQEDVPSRAPESVALLSTGPNSIMVTWSPVPKEYTHGNLLAYHVYYRNQETKAKRSVNTVGAIHALSFNASILSAKITGLSAFKLYAVWLSASTSKGSGPSSTPMTIRTKEDVPRQAPRAVQANCDDSTTIDVTWQPIPPETVPGILRGYHVTYRKTDAVDLKQKNVVTLNSSYHRVIIKGVEPLTQYDVWVAGFTRRGSGPRSVKAHITTPSNVPQSPQGVNVKLLSPRSVKVTWQTPSSSIGHVTRFMVQWMNHGKATVSSQEGRKIVKAGKPYWRETVIGGLTAYSSYSFIVKEETGEENWSEFSEPRDVMMPEDVPSAPYNLSLLKKEGVRLVLAWKAPRSRNGVIQRYLIHFTSDSGAAKTKTLQNGIDEESLTYTLDLPDVASQYRITIQAFNSLPGEVSAVLTVQHSPVDALDSKKSSDFKSKLVWLICGLTVIVLLLVAVLAIVFVRRSTKRSKLKRGTQEKKCKVSIVSKTARPRRPIPVVHLKEHCEHFHANENALFLDEFRSLDLLTWNSACTASRAPMNRSKNRFYDINANDLTRVVLNTFMDIPGSDYINANYVDSYCSPARFIATQGPLAETIGDFWRMVWEKNCPVIVMLEHFENKPSHHLCEQYWPSVGSSEYGQVAVSLLATTEMSEWTMREFIVWSTDPECMDKREVKHLQYKTWPDQGIPRDTGTFLAFHHKFRTLLPSEPSGPIVVHCSAGVGRTGTFIAVDSLIEQMEAEGQVDVYGFVSQTRKQRSFLVQTKEQYCFIYDVLRDASMCGVTDTASLELDSSVVCANVEESESFTRRAKEFECLQAYTVEPTLCSDAQERMNLVKNRCPDVLPFDRNRVRLPAIQDVPSSDYINASYIDGYSVGQMFIATQNPLPNTTKDFWKMVWDQRSCVVIMLNEMKEPEQEDAVQYWPDQTDGCARYGRVQVTKIDEEVLEGLTQRMFKVRHHGSEDSLLLYHFQFHDWADSQSLVYLHEQVQKVKPEENRGPIIVHCSDGASLTGVFLTLSLCIERLECHDTIDLYQTVRWLRAQRPRLVQTANQYNFCYEALRSYLTWRVKGKRNDESAIA